MRTKGRLVSFIFLFIMTSCLNQSGGQKIPGVNGPNINVQNGKIVLNVELESIEMDFGVTLPVSDKMKNSTITVGPAVHEDGTMGGTMIKVAFDLQDVESGHFDVVDPQTLPDGREFPFMVGGTLPAVAVHVPKAKNMTFYASKKLFGFFLPIKLPDGFFGDIHYRIKINGKNYGIVSLIKPNQEGTGAGVIALLTLDEIRKDRGFQKLLKLSKRNKNRMY